MRPPGFRGSDEPHIFGGWWLERSRTRSGGVSKGREGLDCFLFFPVTLPPWTTHSMRNIEMKPPWSLARLASGGHEGLQIPSFLVGSA